MDTHEKKKVNKGEDFAFQLFFNKSLFNHLNEALYYWFIINLGQF